MATTTTRIGRPSKDDLARRERREREEIAAQLARAVQHLDHPSAASGRVFGFSGAIRPLPPQELPSLPEKVP